MLNATRLPALDQLLRSSYQGDFHGSGFSSLGFGFVKYRPALCPGPGDGWLELRAFFRLFLLVLLWRYVWCAGAFWFRAAHHLKNAAPFLC